MKFSQILSVHGAVLLTQWEVPLQRVLVKNNWTRLQVRAAAGSFRKEAASSPQEIRQQNLKFLCEQRPVHLETGVPSMPGSDLCPKFP